MAEKPRILVEIDDLARHVQNTLARSETPLPKTLIKQLGGLISHCLRHQIAGKDAHPGIAKIAKMGGCSERQAQRNLRALEHWNVMGATAFGCGGRWATRYWLDTEALRRALVALGCNPSPQLMEKFEAVRGDIRGDMRGDMMSPGLKKNTGHLATGAKHADGADHE